MKDIGNVWCPWEVGHVKTRHAGSIPVTSDFKVLHSVGAFFCKFDKFMMNLYKIKKENESLKMAHTWTYWSDLMESERSIYMEFYAPIENNVGVMPENNEIVGNQCISPTTSQINCVIDSGDNLMRGSTGFLTVGQHNAVIFWIDEHPEFMQRYMTPVNEINAYETRYNDIIYLGEDDDEIVNIIENIDLLPAAYEESSGEESSGEESSGEESSDEESSDDDLELTDDEDDGLTEN